MLTTLRKASQGLLVLGGLLVACTPSSPPPPPVPASPPSTAVVDYVQGTVTAETAGVAKSLDIGDQVAPGVLVRTGPGSACELRVGTLATVRLSANTVVQWESLVLTAQPRRSQLQLLTGEVLNKVSQLVGDDSYTVRTKTAALGVRGTEFLVRVSSTTLLAVKDGTVAVLPPAFDPTKGLAPDLERSLLTASPGVTSGQKTEVAADAFAERDRLLTNPPSDSAALLASYRAAVGVPPPVQALTPADALDLQPLDAMPLGDATATPAASPSAPPTPPTPQGPQTRRLALTPGVSTAATAIAQGIVLSDGQGTLRAFNSQGRVLWSAPVPAVSNPQASPVADGDLIWTGDSELTLLAAATGKPRWTSPLGAGASGVFGKRALVVASSIYVASADGVAVFDRNTGALKSTLAFPEGSDMTPAVTGKLVVVVGRSGTVVGLDPAQPQPVFSIATSATQPVATAPVVGGDMIWFGDRKGLVVAVSRSAGTVLWSVNLGAGIFDQPVLSGATLLVTVKGQLHALDAATGNQLFSVALLTAPLVSQGLIFGGNGSEVKALNAKGTTLWSASVPAPLSAAPVLWGKEVAFPLEDGSVFLLDPATIGS